MLLDIAQQHLGIILLIVAICAERILPLSRAYHPFTLLKLIFSNIQSRIFDPKSTIQYQYLAGTLGLILPVLTLLTLVWGILYFAIYPQWLAAFILYLCIESKELESAVKKIPALLKHNQKAAARDLLRLWLRRDTASLSEVGIVKASIETLVLRLARHYFAVIFWFLIAGPFVALSYRLINLVHNTWSKKIAPDAAFLKPVQIIDYLFEWLPVRLVACSIILSKHSRLAIRYIGQYGQFFYQKNSGWLLSAMAAAMQIQIGGPALYQKKRYAKMRVGQGPLPSTRAIPHALGILNQVKILWLSVIILLEIAVVFLKI